MNEALLGGAHHRLAGRGAKQAFDVLGEYRLAEEVALPDGDPEVTEVAQLRGVLDAFGDRIQRQASNWGMYKLERALTLLIDTDLTLRSTANVPDMAVMERALLRLAWMGRT